MKLGKQMLFDAQSCACLWSRTFMMSLLAGEFFAMNVRKDFSYSTQDTADSSKAFREAARVFCCVD